MSGARASGILLHPTSLPGKFGIGDLGPEAYAFADFLVECGQSLWQILPLGPSGYGNSPYMCYSAFAGNPLLISPEKLVEDGLLAAEDIREIPPFPASYVDFAAVIDYKQSLMNRAFQKFTGDLSKGYSRGYRRFLEENSFWLEDYSLFMALKEDNGGRTWTDWQEYSQENCNISAECRTRYSSGIQYHQFAQFIFFKQWQELKNYCNKVGIRIIGDIPIYVSFDSADVWANRNLFFLDDEGQPEVISGVPPDYFSATGQRWGNPIYRWDVMQQNGFNWWKSRFGLNFKLFDIVRLDHFRGFEAYWEIPATEPDAVTGRWVKAPGAALFEALIKQFGTLPVIAEDLGVITPEVDRLREFFGFPGMRILQVAFGNDPKALDYRPHNYIRNCAAYTATHDHNTTVGWFTTEPGTQTTQTFDEVIQERKTTLDYLGTDGREINWDFIRLAMNSVADMALFPLQDVLGLDTSARMNLPGTSYGNWTWRFFPDALTPEISVRLHRMTVLSERNR